MYTRLFCLLDRNAVSLIKDSVAGKAQTDSKKISFLNKLRSLDQPKYKVSPLFSIIEGELGKEDSAEEKAACQRKESAAVRSFFKLAKTDSDFLDAISDRVGYVFTTYREGLWSLREEFLNGAVPLIVNKVKKDRRKKVEVQLFELAHASNLRSADLVVVLCLSCLYGSESARSVIKPHEFNAYNVLSDLHVI